MRVQMRQFTAYSLALVLVGSLVSVAPVMAQSPEEAFDTSAGLNADRVDGFHAVKSSGSPSKRKGKLMAFSAKGYLPDNVIKKARDADRLDGLDSTAFATLAALQSSAGAVNEADNPVHWNQLLGVPPTIADGVDNVGYASATQSTTYQIASQSVMGVYADVPLGVDVELFIIPAAGGQLGTMPYFVERGPVVSLVPGAPAVPADTIRRTYMVQNGGAAATQFKVRTRVYNTGIAPAALKKAANKVKVGVTKTVPKLPKAPR